jgi:hypothetical protein
MPLGYKYVERNADSQINWAEVGREASGMLLEVNRVREEKKEAYNQATREEMNNLMNTPQGENQDANGFINNYAHDMIEQMKIDEDLFKRGMLKERDYTLKRQNNMDGTKSLFEIQKLYQQKYKEKMDGVTSGKLQAMNIFNMGMVEGYGDFNNSKATINPADGTVGIGLMENKIIDGKQVRVLSKNIAPVNVIRGKILHDVPTFDVDKATTNTVANFGSRKDILYKAATLSGAGTITELMGPDFLATLTDPVDKKIVEDMNTAIEDQVDSYFAASAYNLSSVLTENVGGYNADSFTFDKDEAAKSWGKILVKVDPRTGMTTLDEDGPNYDAQKKEASEWVRRDILRKMDQERSIKTTAQNELQETAESKEKAAAKYRPKDATQEKLEMDAKNFAENASNFLYGATDEIKDAGLKYMVSLGADIKVNPPGKPKGNYIMNPNGDYVPFQTTGDPVKGGKAAIGALLTATGMRQLPEDLVVKNMKFGQYNTTASGTGVAAKRDYKTEIQAKLDADKDVINSDIFRGQNSVDTGATLAEYFKNADGVVVKPDTTFGYNDVVLTYTPKNAKLKPITVKLNANEGQKTSLTQFANFTKFINSLPDDVKEQFLGPEAGTTGTVTNGKVR